MVVKKIRTVEQCCELLDGHGRTLERHGRQVVAAREDTAKLAAQLESLAKRFGAAYDALLAGGAVPSPASPLVTNGAGPVAAPGEPASQASSGAGDGRVEPEEGPVAGPSWLVVASWAEAQAIMGVLVPWLGEVYLRYPDAALPPCWAWHPYAVEELWWLCRSWHDAYACEAPSAQQAGDWHDRQRPAVVRRLTGERGCETGGSLSLCKLGKHVDPTAHAHPVVAGADTLDHVTTAWACHGRAAWPLVPTQAQLDAWEPARPARTR